jgi:hypothetical protein
MYIFLLPVAIALLASLISFGHRRAQSKHDRLRIAFEKVREGSKRFRESGRTDGRSFWQPIKRQFDGNEDPNHHYKPPQFASFNKYKEDKNELAHFLYQLYNIPENENEPMSVRKVLQLALNIGQFQGSDQGDYAGNFTDRMARIESYIDEDAILALGKKITDEDLTKLNEHLGSAI